MTEKGAQGAFAVSPTLRRAAVSGRLPQALLVYALSNDWGAGPHLQEDLVRIRQPAFCPAGILSLLQTRSNKVCMPGASSCQPPPPPSVRRRCWT